MRKIVVVILILFLFAGIAHASVNGTFEGNPIVKVFSNGKEIETKSVPAVLLNGRTMVPIYMLRDLGATVSWDQETYSVDVFLPIQTEVEVQTQAIDIAKLAKEAKPYGVDFVGYFDDGNGLSQIKYFIGENLFEFEKDLNKWNYVTTTGAYTGATFLEIADPQNNYFNVPTKALRDYYGGLITAEQLVSQYEVNANVPYLEPIDVPALPIQDVDLTTSVIKSKVVGDFDGFDYGNIYELDNGQFWKQVDYTFRYSYKYRPDVLVYKDGLFYYMSVDGIDRHPRVELIR